MATAVPTAGVLTTLVTPFRDDALDEAALGRLVEAQAAAGVAGVVVCGVISESFALTATERTRVVRTAVAAAGGRVPILAEVGTNATAHSVDHARRAAAAGAAAIILPTPYYNKPSQEGVARHVAAVADAVDLPVLLANGADRCGMEIGPALLKRLAAEGRLAGYVETSGSIERIAAVRRALDGRVRLWAANDFVFANTPGLPVDGFSSVLATLVPRACARLAAERVFDAAVAKMVDLLYASDGPGLVKHILASVDPRVGSGVRLPLLPLPPRLAAEAAELAALVRRMNEREAQDRSASTSRISAR